MMVNDIKEMMEEDWENYREEKNKLVGSMEYSVDNIDDEGLKAKFIVSQKERLELKSEKAQEIILQAAAAAAIVGAVPLPFADAAILTPLQSYAVYRIFSVYGFNDVDDIIKGIIAGSMMTCIGKAAVGGILKLIPGVGWFIGGTINAGVAAALTAALCGAVSQLCYQGIKDVLDGKDVNWLELFSDSVFSDVFKDVLKNTNAKKLKKSIKSVKLDEGFKNVVKKIKRHGTK